MTESPPITQSDLDLVRDVYMSRAQRAVYDRLVESLAEAEAKVEELEAAPKISDVTRQLIERDHAGRAKYGTTLDRDDLTTADWLQHMAEELLDGAGYALAAKRELQLAKAVDSPTPPAEAQPGAWPSAWRILWSPDLPETCELTSDGERVLKVQALDDPPYIQPLYAVPAEAQVAGGLGDGMLPDALVPHAKEWYRLCERRFAVERMTISGELAEAIVAALSAQPQPASAPVGVEGLAFEWEKRAGELSDEGLYGCCAGTYEKCAAQLRILAQQPAAPNISSAHSAAGSAHLSRWNARACVEADRHAMQVEVERLRAALQQANKDFGCELRDPNGTIWEYAAKQKARADRLEEVLLDGNRHRGTCPRAYSADGSCNCGLDAAIDAARKEQGQ